MEHHSTSTSSSEDFYSSAIISGAHGDKYQQYLAMAIFERATRKGYDFQLGYEMAIADKFDDVVFFKKTTNTWTLIQTKHADSSKGIPSPLKFEMLFPEDERTREKGDFSLYKYLKSYVTVQSNIKERKNCIIFTNRNLDKSIEQLVEIEPRPVDDVFLFNDARHIGLKISDSLIKEMVDYVNKDLDKKLKRLLQKQNMKNYKDPKTRKLPKSNITTKHTEKFSSEARQFQEGGKMLLKTVAPWSLSGIEEIVHQFFQNLTLSVQQPDELCNIIDQDLRLWMRTWILPSYFQRFEESQLAIVNVQFENFFNFKISQGEMTKGNYYKKFLQLADGKEFFSIIERDLMKQIQNMSHYNATDYYISRQIQYIEQLNECPHSNNSDQYKTIHEEELFKIFNNHKLLLLTAEPGMGKTTVLEYIALSAQRRNNDQIYLFHLNTLSQNLEDLNDTNAFDRFLSVLRTVLSESNFKNLRESIEFKYFKRKHFIIFDGFEEVLPSARKLILEIFKQILKAPNVTIFVSARRSVKTLIENEFHVKSMNLLPFNSQDKLNFLRQLWKVTEQTESVFYAYVTHLFKCFQSEINRALNEFIGVPLLLKMLGEIYADNFNEYLCSEQSELESFLQIEYIGISNTINLYEAFVKKCFDNKLNKKFDKFEMDVDEEYYILFQNLNSRLFEAFTLEHQLLAIKILHINDVEFVFSKNKHLETLNSFEKRILSGSERSPLVEAVDNHIRFIHRSYAEFLVAKFLFSYLEDFEVEIFGIDSQAHLFDEYPITKTLFFAMIEFEHKPKLLEILAKHYRENKLIAFWACEAQGQKTVEYLLQTMCDSTIINQLFDVAVQHNYFNICTFLFENHKVIPDYKCNGNTPLYTAAAEGHKDIVQLLIHHCANVNNSGNDGWTPLHVAAKHGHFEVVKTLMSHCGDVNAKQNNQLTPLHLAVKNGHINTIKILIENSADINAKDIDESTPLHIAAKYNHTDVVKILIEHSSDLNAKNSEGDTPLHIAAKYNHTDVVKMLIEYSSDLKAKNTEGDTPLHIAAKYNHTDVVKMLIEHSSDLSANNSELYTLLDFAAGLLDFVKFFISSLHKK